MELLHQPSRTEGVNGSGRKHRIGRMGQMPGESVPQRAVMERGTAPRGQPVAGSFPFQEVLAPGSVRAAMGSGRFRCFRPISSHSGFWMPCRSGPCGWFPKQPSALNSSYRGRCSFCVLLRCGHEAAACVLLRRCWIHRPNCVEAVLGAKRIRYRGWPYWSSPNVTKCQSTGRWADW
jgi:hypothetical protein